MCVTKKVQSFSFVGFWRQINEIIIIIETYFWKICKDEFVVLTPDFYIFSKGSEESENLNTTASTSDTAVTLTTTLQPKTLLATVELNTTTEPPASYSSLTKISTTVTTTTSTMTTPEGYPPNCVSMKCKIMFNSNSNFRSYIWRIHFQTVLVK